MTQFFPPFLILKNYVCAHTGNKKYMVICFIADYHVLFCMIRVMSRESV